MSKTYKDYHKFEEDKLIPFRKKKALKLSAQLKRRKERRAKRQELDYFINNSNNESE